MKQMHRRAEPGNQVYSLAIAIEGEENRLLYARRNEKVADYKGFWSIPSTSVSEEIYKKAINEEIIPVDILKRLSTYVGTKVSIDKLLIKGERIRSHYHLHQAVFKARVKAAPVISGIKYDAIDYLNPDELMKKTKGYVGTCISLYLQYLISHGCLSSTFDYYEISPEIASGELIPGETSSEHLWCLAAPNYELLLEGRTGSDGAWLRSLTLDRYMISEVRKYAKERKSILDSGCGEGDLVESALLNGADAWGLDLKKPKNNAVKSRVLSGDILEAHNIFTDKHFDIVIANLLLEWVDDLREAMYSLSQCINKSGRIIASFTTPEFSHAGEWTSEGENNIWLQKKSIKRKSELVMINRCVGPVRFYPRSTADIITQAVSAGLAVCGMHDLYINSFLSNEELAEVLEKYPQLSRHQMLPLFRIIEFSY